jgi:hypothetical protein
MDDDESLKIIKDLIENGICVDKILREPTSYSFVYLNELQNELFGIIVDLLHKKLVIHSFFFSSLFHLHFSFKIKKI